MKYLKSCNGCLEKKLTYIPSLNINICQNCLLVSSNYKKKYSSVIKEDFKSNKFYNWNNQMESLEERSKKNYFFFKKIFKFTKIKKKEKVLDFGSGYGPLLHILKQKKIKALGLEPSKKNSKISKKLGHNVINNYLNDRTFNKKSFKVIVSLYTFTYINDLAKKFKIFRKILKNNGYLLIRVHQYKFSKSYHQLNHFKKLVKAGHTFNHFSDNSLKNLFNFHNFDIMLFDRNIEGITIIAKKIKKKKFYKIGNFNFEVFYIKYLVFLISNIMLFVHGIKIKIRKIIF